MRVIVKLYDEFVNGIVADSDSRHWGDWSLNTTKDVALGEGFEFRSEDNVDAKMPNKIEDLDASVKIVSTFNGFRDEGLVHYGSAKMDVSYSRNLMTTSIEIRSDGSAKKALHDAMTLYRMIRKDHLPDNYYYEKWTHEFDDQDDQEEK